MKLKQYIITAVLLTIVGQIQAKMTIGQVVGHEWAAQTVREMNPMPGTDLYLKRSDDGKKLISCSFKTGNQVQTLFDVDNTHGEKIKEFERYILSPDGTKMLISTETEPIYRRSSKAFWYIYNIATRRLEKLSEGGKQEVPVWSNNGNLVAFIRDNNIFLVKLLYNNSESQVTKDGKLNEVINGKPDWVNEEEFEFNRSLCFNADGTSICWLKYEEKDVKSYSLQMFKGLNPEMGENADYPSFYSYKYPKAGQDNSKVTAWSYDIKSHRTVQLQVPLDADGYMPRIKATDNPDKVVVYTLNRHQDELNLYAVNPASTVAQLIVKEKVDKFFKESNINDIAFYGDRILLPSDRDGYVRLYLYGMNGQLLRTVGGDYDITAVYGYDTLTGDIYYQAANINAHDRQVMVSRKNGKTERLTDREGWNDAVFCGNYKYFVNTWSNINTPYVVTVRNNMGKVLSTTIDNAELKKKIKQAGWRDKEMFSFTTSEGITLDGWMIKPADYTPSKKYPVIMFQYGGPGSQQVTNSWNVGSMGRGGAFDYYLAEQGFIVVCVDGRGTAGRGSVFEKSIYLQMGELEARDQVETAIWLGKQDYVDKDHIGIWGWSFGGFNTLMSMSEGRPVFYAGVAVAPPTNWKYYDSIYTERYMRTPQENPTGYQINPINRASQLSGALLICHGVADDNVHPQNTFEYSEALVQADKDFRELLYTNRNHSIYGGNTRNHLLRQIATHFIENLRK